MPVTRGYTLPLVLVAALLPAMPANAGPVPEVFDTPHYQAPVRASPGDVLVIPGFGFEPGARVVYRRMTGSSVPPPPAPPPASNSATTGMLEVIDVAGDSDSFNNAPYSVAARLPVVMQAEEPYALWVQNPGAAPGQWSEPIVINDPRPLFVSPGLTYETQSVGSNPRSLRVVGRNLEREMLIFPLPAQVRLSGPSVYTLTADPPLPDLEHYVVDADLPRHLKAGTYTVELSLDGSTWYPVADNGLTVRKNPSQKPIFPVHGYASGDHPCEPDDGIDDTWCIREALVDAALVGGGEVFFEDGQWDLIDPELAHAPGILGNHTHIGLLVPRNVDLVGTHRELAKIVKHPEWDTLTVFTLMGDNEVSDLHFDEDVVGSAPTTNTSFLRLGNISWVSVPKPVDTVSEVAIHDTRFTDMQYAISDGGYPIEDLFITDNEFQVYNIALQIAGGTNHRHTFTMQDAVIADNVFWPGDYVGAYNDAGAPTQGTIASGLGAGRRVDFSRNVANGAVNGGWRAAYFWHMRGSLEMQLVSENVGLCTSDKAGDGEFIAYDGNADFPGLEGQADVLDASPHDVVVSKPFRDPYKDWQKLNPGFYQDHWVVVVDGPGLGQARPISDYGLSDEPSIKVDPPWDVTPVPKESKVVVVRAYWSTFTVGNEVDDSVAAGCAKTNPIGVGKGGAMGWFGATFDSSFENNLQVEADGIGASSGYAGVEYFEYEDAQGNPQQLYMGFRTQPIYANEIRGNVIDEEYRYNPGGQSSSGGIWLHYGAEPSEPAPVLAFNLAVSHNDILRSDSVSYHGALTLRLSWYAGADPSQAGPGGGPADLYRAASFYRNMVDPVPWGISIPHPYGYATVLADNIDTTTLAAPSVQDLGTQTFTFP